MMFSPEGNLRVAELEHFLEFMKSAFGVSKWVTPDQNVLDDTARGLQSYLEGQGKLQPPSTVSMMTLCPGEGDYPIMICTSTGSDGGTWDNMWVDFHDKHAVPDLSYFRRCIETCRPTIADISHTDNEFDLKAGERAYAQGHHGIGKRPVIVNWFHYFTEEIADTFGGIAHCLRMPAYKAEPFWEGILIQLTDDPFDPTNQQHLDAQRRAMEHLGLPWEFEPE